MSEIDWETVVFFQENSKVIQMAMWTNRVHFLQTCRNIYLPKVEKCLAGSMTVTCENIPMKNLIKMSVLYREHALLEVPLKKLCHKAGIFWLIFRKWIKKYILFSGKLFFSNCSFGQVNYSFCRPAEKVSTKYGKYFTRYLTTKRK